MPGCREHPPSGHRGLIALLAFAIGCAGERPPLAPDGTTPGSSYAVEFELSELSVTDLQRGMTMGRYTSRGLVERYLERVAEIDASGPHLRSVIEINPDAPAIAEALDVERRTSGARGPLHGIPVLIKDNIDTGDRMLTTAGSLALAGEPVERDAFLVQRLRRAGAVILGKTNLSEWANMRSTRSTSGWSARGGFVRNPYVLDRSPCGSSSGTGAAIAASLAAVGVGTETDGSIVCPSAVQALVGIKPTVGLVSRVGLIPIAPSQDTAGPMARTVADAALLLAAIAGADPQDAATTRAPAPPDYAAALQGDALRGARIGLARGSYMGYSPAADRLIETAIAGMRAAGAIVVDPVVVPGPAQLRSCEMVVLLHEFKAGLDAYLGERKPPAQVRSLPDVIAFNEQARATEMVHFGQEIFLSAAGSGPLTSPRYLQALADCRRIAQGGIDEAMTRDRLDAIVAPALGPAWTVDLEAGDAISGAGSIATAVAGYPSITVPAGWVGELPVGILFMGRAWSEARLIGLAHAYEQATRHRRPPRFLPTAPPD